MKWETLSRQAGHSKDLRISEIQIQEFLMEEEFFSHFSPHSHSTIHRLQDIKLIASYLWSLFPSPPLKWHCQSVQLLSHVRLFVTPWTAEHQASLYITNSSSLLKLMSIELVMPSQPPHPLLSPSPPAFNLSWHQYLFQSVSSLHKVGKVLEFQLQSFQWIFRTGFL